MSNRRSRYRVEPRPQDQLRAVVLSTTGGMAIGEVLDLSSGGIGMSFDRRPLPVFPLRSRVEIRISSPYLPETIIVTATVCRRSEQEPLRVYGFSFDAAQSRLAASAPGLGRLFNQRSAQRVLPNAGEPRDATIQGTLPPSRISGTTRDISVTGVSIEAPNELGHILTRGEIVRVALHLGRPGKLVLDGKVTRREILGATIVYGIVFGGPRTIGRRKKLEILATYVAGRAATDAGSPQKKPDQSRSVSFRP